MASQNREGARKAIDVDALIAAIRVELGMPPQAGARAPLDGKTLLSRVRAEVARREALATQAVEGGRSLIEWSPSEPRLPAKREYVLADLTGFDDEDFVLNAYLAVLRRAPDAEGFNAALHALRQGTSKVEVLGKLRWSEEGLARGVHIDGLLLPYTLQRWEQKPIVGMPIAWLHGLVKLGVNGRRQRIAEARQAREAHALGRLLNRLAQADGETRQETGIALKRIASESQRGREDLAARLRARSDELSSDIGRLQDGIATQLAGLELRSTEKLDATRQALALDLQRVGGELYQARQAMAVLREALEAAETRLGQLAQWEAEARAAKASKAQQEAYSRSLDPLYADFEDEFRGARETIRKRVAPYLEWVREGGDIDAAAPVLDIGCGRGEWLELAREHGIAVRGIDLNRNFAASCRGLGLDIMEGDAIAMLRTLPDASIGAITSMHLVEHLPFETLVQLLDESYRVLRPGGVIALETPNPENLSVSSHWFFLDPTHRNPLPPVTLAWLVRERGFVDPRIERLTAERDLGAPPLLTDDVAGAESVNVLLERLHAAADYSIVARKPNA